MRRHDMSTRTVRHGRERSASAAGLVLLALALWLGGCGDTLEPPPPPALDPTTGTQEQPLSLGDGPYHGRPATLGSCTKAQTQSSYQQSDALWSRGRNAIIKYLQCRLYDGKLDYDRMGVCPHLLRGVNPFSDNKCLSGEGTSSKSTECNDYNSYKAHEQVHLNLLLTQDAKRGVSLTPEHIFKRAMEASDNDVEGALWTAYRITNRATGDGAASYPSLVGAMPSMYSSCSPLANDVGLRAGLYYHFYLLTAITFCYGPGAGELGHLFDRTASFNSAVGDPDKSTANWEGMKLALQLGAFQLITGAFDSNAHCSKANADSNQLFVGQSTTLQLGQNDEATPRSLLTNSPPVLVASVGSVPVGLSVSSLGGTSVNVSASGPPGPKVFRYALTDGTLMSNDADVTVNVRCPLATPDWNPQLNQCTAQCGDCQGNKYCTTASGTPTCVCPADKPSWNPATLLCSNCPCTGGRLCDESSGSLVCKCPADKPNWNAATEQCELPATCGTSATASGGDEGYTRTYNLGGTSGTMSLTFETYSVQDRIKVMYQGATLIDTGCVGANGTKSAPYSGTATQATVVVEPNCAGGSGTAWDFTFNCGS